MNVNKGTVFTYLARFLTLAKCIGFVPSIPHHSFERMGIFQGKNIIAAIAVFYVRLLTLLFSNEIY